MRKISKILLSFTLFFLIVTISNLNISASTNKVYLGGENIGIKLNTGIEIIGKYEVETEQGKIKPWLSSNVEKGDTILSIDGVKVSSNQSLLNVLGTSKNDQVKLTLKRNNKIFDTTINVVVSKNNQKSIGLYIKDKVLGIGTLTFVDPNSLKFASLGHGIYDGNELYDVSNGVILSSTVNSIRKATPGVAGEKKASLNSSVIGSISSNSNTGLYGKVVKNFVKNKELIEIARQDEIKIGPASIVTTLTNNVPTKYDIEILEINSQKTKDIKGIKIKINDDRLIKETGGIVQGMSGSPIIQNGKIIGAVSHVVIDNPTIGYGMYIEWMLNDLNCTNCD